jgi:hypothetical protein
MRILWAFASESRQKLALVIFRMANRPWNEKLRAVAVAWIFGGLVGTIIRSVIRDIRDDEDEDFFDERNWDPLRFVLQTLTAPLGGIPVLGDMVEGLIYKATGEYLPEGNLLSSSGGLLRLKNIPDWFSGESDIPDILVDIDRILSAVALTSDTAAAAAAGWHMVSDAASIIDNFLPE